MTQNRENNFKVFLVYPPISKQERYSSEIGNSGGNQIPLGIYYLAAYLRQFDIGVTVRDGEAQQLTAEDIVDEINDQSPDLVAISSTTVAFHRALDLSQQIKKSTVDTPIVIGGPHVTSNALHAMEHSVFDYGVIGEGEETLLDLVKVLCENKPVENVNGLVWRHGDQVKINQPRAYINDLDALPFPAYDLVSDLSLYTPPPSNYKKTPVANVMTSRGCPSRCTFCDNSTFGTRFRQRSAQNIANEIEMLNKEYGVQEIAFVDDTFTINKERIYEIFNELSEREISLPWTCMSRINSVDYDLLEYMRDHGCWHISFGIESGNQEILKLIKKNISLDNVRKVVKWCSDLGIKTKGFFIVGHPGETVQTINATIEFALELPLDDVVVTINTPIPGSTQYAEASKWGSLDETNWAEFNYWRPVFVPNGLTKEVRLEKQREFYRKFYLRPHILLRYGLSFLSSSGPRRFLSLLRSLPFLFKRSEA